MTKITYRKGAEQMSYPTPQDRNQWAGFQWPGACDSCHEDSGFRPTPEHGPGKFQCTMCGSIVTTRHGRL